MSMRCITTWTFNPNEPFELARRYADLEGTVFFHSGGPFDSVHFSFLCLFPDEKLEVPVHAEGWNSLQEGLGSLNETGPLPKWVGFLCYEMGCVADRHKQTAYLKPDLPGALFYRPTVIVVFDHFNKKAALWTTLKSIALLRQPPLPFRKGAFSLQYASDDLKSYTKKVLQAQEWIREGEIYQVNLSQEFRFKGTASPFLLFKEICALNPAPFSAFLNGDGFSIISSSPERLVRKRGASLETRPIKGTAPRGKTKEQDELRRHELLTSEKERAELLMITDLMRNDLGKVSLPGSLQVREMWRCEAYPNVFHLLSIIEAECLPDKKPVDVIRALFPGGSVTGCPKWRAMEAIYALENRPRCIYTGSIGYFAQNGDFDFNIAIRTLLMRGEEIRMQLGGAVMIDSDPIKEFEETLHKGRSLLTLLGYRL